jgi:hypothetical protein
MEPELQSDFSAFPYCICVKKSQLEKMAIKGNFSCLRPVKWNIFILMKNCVSIRHIHGMPPLSTQSYLFS